MFAFETWRPIPSWEGVYEISSHGRLRSCDRLIASSYGKIRTLPGKMLRPWLQQGYPIFALQDRARGKYRRTSIHRLVCETFHGQPPSPYHEVAHIDGNRANARAENLRWATHVENEADKREHGTALIGELHPCAKLTVENVTEIRASRERPCDLARRFNVSPSQISVIRNGRSWREMLVEAA